MEVQDRAQHRDRRRDRGGCLLRPRRRTRGGHLRSRPVGAVRRRHRLPRAALVPRTPVHAERARRPPPRAALRRHRAGRLFCYMARLRMWETGLGELAWFCWPERSSTRRWRYTATRAATGLSGASAGPILGGDGGHGDRARREGPSEGRCASSVARCPTSPASTCSATPGPGDLRRQGEVGAQARGLALLQGAGAEQSRARRDGRRSRARWSAWWSPPRRRRCWPSRASSSSTGRASTSACATTSPTRSSRSLSTRTTRGCTSRASATAASRAYFGPYSNAKRVRSTLEVLAKVFMFRSCTGAEPGRRSGSPCLDYYIKRCGAPCVGYVDARGVPRPAIDGVIDFLSGRFCDDRARPGEAHARGRRARGVRAGDARAQSAAGGALAAGAAARDRRVDGYLRRGRGRAGRAGRPTPRSSRCATGCSPTASPSTSPTRPSANAAEVAEEFMLQYYGGQHLDPGAAGAPARGGRATGAGRRAGEPPRRAGRAAGRRAWREAPHPRAGGAQRAAGARSGQAALRAPAPGPGGGAGGVAVGARSRRAADPHRVLRHLQPGRHAHGRLDGRLRGRGAEEVRLPPLQDPHAPRARPTTSPRWPRC